MKILIFLNSSLTPLPMKKFFWLADLQKDTITLMETVHALVLWDCRFALPAFPSSPCFNTWSKHDVATVKLYLLLRWYCETVLITPLVLWNCRIALPAFPSSPCLNTWSKHDVTSYCERLQIKYIVLIRSGVSYDNWHRIFLCMIHISLNVW